MSWLKAKFIEHFNVNHIGIDLIDMLEEVDGDKLSEYITKQFSDNFTPEEITEKFKDELPEQELKKFLDELF